MSGCHNPNVCYHVDGEFCDRCYTPEQITNLEALKNHFEMQLKELRTNLSEVTNWCCRIECELYGNQSRNELNAKLPSIGELNAIVARELNDGASAAFWFNQADKYKNENRELRKYVKEKETKFQALSKKYGELSQKLEETIMTLCVKQQQHRDTNAELVKVKKSLHQQAKELGILNEDQT